MALDPNAARVVLAAGSRVQCARGVVGVEALVVGDRLPMQDGREGEVLAIVIVEAPHGEVCGLADADAGQPVRLLAGAVLQGLPAREMLLHPGQAILFAGQPFAASELVNGWNITRAALRPMLWYWVALSEIGVVVVEGAPLACLPPANDGNGPGSAAAEARRQGLTQLRSLVLWQADLRTTRDPGLRVLPVSDGVLLLSRAVVPYECMPESDDRRRLGVRVLELFAGGERIALDDPELVSGWHAPEPPGGGRWTDGAALVPGRLLAGRHPVELRLADTLSYPLTPEQAREPGGSSGAVSPEIGGGPHLALPRERPGTDGHIDHWGLLAGPGMLILMGWVSTRWNRHGGECAITFEPAGARAAGRASFCLYGREDVREVGSGIVLCVADAAPDALGAVILETRDGRFRLEASHTIQHLGEPDLKLRAGAALRLAIAGESRSSIARALTGAAFAGSDTFGELTLAVHLELDGLYLCPPSGLLLHGWWSDPHLRIASCRIVCGGSSRAVDLAACARGTREDVVRTYRDRGIVLDRATGFLVYLPRDAFSSAAPTYLEIRTTGGEIAYKPFGPPVGASIASLRHLLDGIAAEPGELDRLFDDAVGPAVLAISRFRLEHPPAEQVRQFGPRPEAPLASLIVPLYGRIDLMEIQCVLMGRQLAAAHELIYVLDDPSLAEAALRLAASCHARFGVPLRLVLLSHNVGYAPANNAGLRHARGPAVCFLNSDVAPLSRDWLGRLLETLAREPKAGIVGARLLFEDGTVQHDGCRLEPSEAHAGWRFPEHPGKGEIAAPAPAIEAVEAVTGACMVMRTDLARALGGFDTDYALGDFEDADLCRRVRARGLRCLIDRQAVLFHAERMSQGDQVQRWRSNLTLFNAWVFNRRWPAEAVDG